MPCMYMYVHVHSTYMVYMYSLVYTGSACSVIHYLSDWHYGDVHVH